MKVSINNFKSIGKLQDFQIRPLTILSGNNSSGKSSFLQLLLLLKQTLEIESTKHSLYLKGKYYSVRSFLDLIKGKDPDKYIEIQFVVDKEEFSRFGSLIQTSLFDSFSDYTCTLSIRYGWGGREIVIREFSLSYLTEVKNEYLILKTGSNGKIEVDCNSSYLLKYDSVEDGSVDTKRVISDVAYSAFFPTAIEESTKVINSQILDIDGNFTFTQSFSTSTPNIGSIKSFINNYFKSIYYIGPLRIEPKDSYEVNQEADWVGVKGEYTAQILESFKETMIKFNRPTFEDDCIKFSEIEITLLEATNIWMCEVFGFGKRLYSKEVGESYSVFLETRNGIDTTIKHVGFGISQILPIVVQGLLVGNGGTLILEQPEIHLHPKVQSYLFDFLYSLILQKKNVIVETHSDHLITRLRRRVAEEEEAQLSQILNLTFIESGKDDLNFKEIKLDDLGTYQIFPEDFIESPEKELQALLKAQMKKRKLKRN